jgi:hypothetical protein
MSILPKKRNAEFGVFRGSREYFRNLFMRCGFSGIKQYMRKRFLRTGAICGILFVILFCAGLYAQTPPWPPSKPPASQPEAKKPRPKQQDWLDGTQKRLETLNSIMMPDAENADFKSLAARAAELLDQAKSSKDNQFQSRRRLLAANAIMDAADRVLLALKPIRNPEENDSRAAGFVLRGCYFRMRQANYFADISGNKKSHQYVKLASSLYQQGRSAYDAREYGKARLLGDASTMVVFALECMAQAATPDPHIYK